MRKCCPSPQQKIPQSVPLQLRQLSRNEEPEARALTAGTVLCAGLGELTEEDWLKTVRIRGEEHGVLQALQRNLTHTVYHVGQIVYLARLLKTTGWNWITIPPGLSKQHAKTYLK